MQVSELAQRSGCSIATIKFYIREGLLAPGPTTSRTRAEYDDSHLARLRLIRALLDVGDLPLATARSVIEVMNAGAHDEDEIVRRAINALGSEPVVRDPEAFAAARDDVGALVAGLGWNVDPDARAIDLLAAALATLRETYGAVVPAELLLAYAEVALGVATDEMGRRPAALDSAGLVEWAVTGTVVFERVLVAWRRLAHEHLARGGG